MIRPNCFTEMRTEEAKQQRREHRAKYGKDFSPRRGKVAVLRTDEVANCLVTSPTIEQTIALPIGGEYRMTTLTVNDFFCGAGGMGIGFKNAGFRLGGAWDFDKYAVESYGHNVSPKVKQADITQMTAEDVPNSDVWTFGFPCQDISVAGTQAGMVKGETRSGLFYEVMRLLDETTEKPKIILAENVKAVKKYLPEIEKEYAERGYKFYSILYNSKYWGVPQNRDRYFMIGVHESIEKEFIFPVQQTEFVPKLSTVLEVEVDEKYYLKDSIAAEIIEKAKEIGKLTSAQGITPYPTLADGSSYAITTRTHACYLQHHVDRKLATLVAENDEQWKVRKLTPRESFRLQGFPDSFEIVVSNAQAYKQAGNAVTVNVAQAIAERIRMFLLSL